MRRWHQFLCWMAGALLMASSCVQELPEQPVTGGDPFPEGGKVTITFSIPAPEGCVGTKGIGEDGNLNTLHVAVFGSSGYLKEYVKAMRLGETGEGDWAEETYTYKDPYWDENMSAEEQAKHTHTVPLIKFAATLSLSEKSRIIHFVGNGPATLPYDADTTVMATLMSEGGEGGFWQIRRMERIGALKDDFGHYINKEGEIIQDGTGYVPDKYTNDQFNKVPLVRNWAKISILADDSEQSNFTPISFAVINVPSKGTVAPLWKGTQGSLMFVEDFEKKTFEDLSTVLKYPSSLPDEAIFDESIPAPENFIQYDNGNGAAFLYERPVPNEYLKATFVIIYGTYKTDGNNYYYKVDLADGGYYYPIYRNFNYQIHITKVGARGFSTPKGAAESMGGVEISTEVSTSHLGDISDGIAQLSVRPWMSQSFHMQQHDNSVLSVKFFEDITTASPQVNQSYQDSVIESQKVTKVVDGQDVYIVSNQPNAQNNPITWELLPADDGGEDVITDVFIGHPFVADSEDPSAAWTDGWRQIYFSTISPEAGTQPRTQALRIMATFIERDVPKVLFRDIMITILPPQQMKLSCLKPVLESEEGAEQTLTILIPEGLPQSMFPLEFTIEPENMTLMPKPGSNMPVVHGPSIVIPATDKPTGTFQFVRTLTYDEYTDPHIESVKDPDNGSMWRPVTSEFVATRADNATTIWVASNNFETKSTAFQNAAKLFRNVTIPSFELADLQNPNYSFSIHFDVEESYRYGFPQITLLARGVTVASGLPDGTTVTSNGDGSVSYVYKATQKAQDIVWKLTSALAYSISETEGQFSIDISARDEDGYTPVSVALRRFTDCRFMDGIYSGSRNAYSNVMFGYVNTANAKAAPLGYRDDPEYPAVVKLLNDDDTPFVYLGYSGQSTKGIPTVDNFTDATYHEIGFYSKNNNSASNTDPFSFRMTAPSYLTKKVTAGRFSGGNAIGNYGHVPIVNSSLDNKQEASFNFTNNCNVKVQFDRTVTLENDNLKLTKSSTEGSDTYWMKVQSLTNGSKPLYYIEITFAEGSTVPAMSVDVGTISRYGGSTAQQYIWNLPLPDNEGHTDASAHQITFTSGSDVKISTVVIRGVGKAGATFVDYSNQ